jgi:DNA-binding SARP family transcriptional activator
MRPGVGSEAGTALRGGSPLFARRPSSGPSAGGASRPDPTFHVRLTGAFSLRRRGETVHLPISAQRLVAYLALSDGPCQRSHVAGTFWPEVGEDRAMANLRSVIWRVRRSGCDILAVEDGQLSLRAEVIVDARELRRIALGILATSEATYPADFEDLVRAEEILPDWSDEWVLVDRERYRQLRVHALERLCGQLASVGRFGLAVEACLVALASEPLRESTQRQLIEVYLSEGNRADALRQYSLYRRIIREEVGVEPSREITDLVDGLALAGGVGR